MRTCVASGVNLHIIGPLTYKIDDKGLRRAGMDYLVGFDYKYYESYEEFVLKNNNPIVHYITRYGKKAPSSVDFSNIKDDIYVMFGKESTGIPKEILKDHLDYCFRIPMLEGVRSLNLSNCVAIVVYEILRQKNYEGLSSVETIKGEDFLENN